MTTPLRQLRCRVESLLQKFPYLFEAVSAAVVGFALAAAAFGAGNAVFGVGPGFLLSIVALMTGFALGWILASLLLFSVFLFFALVCPKSKGIIFVSASVALAGAMAHLVFYAISFLTAAAYFCLFYLLAALACEILISLWSVGWRIASTVRGKNEESDP